MKRWERFDIFITFKVSICPPSAWSVSVLHCRRLPVHLSPVRYTRLVRSQTWLSVALCAKQLTFTGCISITLLLYVISCEGRIFKSGESNTIYLSCCLSSYGKGTARWGGAASPDFRESTHLLHHIVLWSFGVNNWFVMTWRLTRIADALRY